MLIITVVLFLLWQSLFWSNWEPFRWRKKKAMMHLSTSSEHLVPPRFVSNTNHSKADRQGETDVKAVKLITQQHSLTPCPSPSRWSTVCVLCVEPRHFKILISGLASVHSLPHPQATIKWVWISRFFFSSFSYSCFQNPLPVSFCVCVLLTSSFWALSLLRGSRGKLRLLASASERRSK